MGLKADEDLLPGTVFAYSGPKRGLLRRSGVAAGRVLSVEAVAGIVHVRTLFQCGDDNCVDIGFMPVLRSALEQSIVHLGPVADLPQDWWPALASWREAYAQGVAGGFSCLLWQAEQMAWDTVREHEPDAGRDNVYIEFAYPRRGTTGRFDSVVVSCSKRSQNTDGLG